MVVIILGILSIVLAGISFFVFWWLGIIAAILGIIGVILFQNNKEQKDAKIGLTCSIIGLSLGVISVILWWILVALMVR